MKQSIIFLHGLFGSLSNWQESVNFFKNDYNIHVPTLSLYDRHQHHLLESLVEVLDKEIDTLGLKNVSMVGNSLGGHLAILYAHCYPQKVDKLILTGSSGLYENFMIGSFPRRNDRKYIRAHIENVFHDPKHATEELIEEVFEVLSDNRKCIGIIKSAKATQRHSVRDILPRIQKPVLLIWGDNDRVTPPEVAKEFAHLLPAASLLFFNECGHAAMMEKPEDFNKALHGFL
ncbi:alpha/beta hydrolase [Pedobacter miscanthi]|uniref:alpha/beta fold hydrolase n=1 Tax=Pedobacter miscanthi TaxID=2259170 RepID=UPI00292F9B88|nr:alpha/beta hydrolase [Pedobacter miscanthi]